MAIPAVVTLVADPLKGLVDTAVIGRVGTAELGALGLAVAVLAAVAWIFNFLVFGTTSTVARAVGAGDLAAAGRRVSHAAQIALVLGVTVGLALFVFAPALITIAGAVEELREPAIEYLRIRAIGVPLLLVGYVGHGAFRGVSDTRTPLLIVAAANIFNAVATVALVLGLGWGIAGAAWTTVGAEALIVAALVARIAKTGLPLAGHGRPGRAQIKAMVVVSRDLFLRTGALLAGLFAITAAASRIGAETAAAHQVLYQSFLLVSFLMDGFAVAGQSLVATALGAGRVAEARAYGRDLLWWGIGGGVVVTSVLVAGAGFWPNLLTNEPMVLATVGSTWALAACGHLINGPVFALDGVLMGAEDFAYLRTWTMLAAVVGGGIGQAVAFTGGGIVGLWIAVQAMMLVRLVSLALRVRGSTWARTGADLVS